MYNKGRPGTLGGAFTVGIGPDGELYDTGSSTGFARNSDGYDPLSAGTPRDSWGLSVNGAPGVYADQFLYGNNGVTSSSTYTANSATVTSSTKVDYAVVQDYSFLAPNVMEISGMVTNDSGAAGSVVFQRDIAWEVPPTLFDGTSSGNAINPATNVVDSSYYGLEPADTSQAYSSSCASGC